MKTCSVCKACKPIEEFGLLTRNKDGRAGRCKACARLAVMRSKELHPETKLRANHTEAAKERAKRFYETHPDYHKQQYALHKGKIKERVRAYRKKNGAVLAVKKQEYYEKNKTRFIAKAAVRWRNNKEKVSAINAVWRKANPEKAAEYYKAHKMRHPGRVAELRRAWKLANPHHVAAGLALRRARKKSATPAWANTFFIREAYHLAKLRTKATGFKWEVDHIYPLQSDVVCGLHVEHNLQVIPATLNRSKGNKVIHHG